MSMKISGSAIGGHHALTAYKIPCLVQVTYFHSLALHGVNCQDMIISAVNSNDKN